METHQLWRVKTACVPCGERMARGEEQAGRGRGANRTDFWQWTPLCRIFCPTKEGSRSNSVFNCPRVLKGGSQDPANHPTLINETTGKLHSHPTWCSKGLLMIYGSHGKVIICLLQEGCEQSLITQAVNNSCYWYLFKICNPFACLTFFFFKLLIAHNHLLKWVNVFSWRFDKQPPKQDADALVWVSRYSYRGSKTRWGNLVLGYITTRRPHAASWMLFSVYSSKGCFHGHF